MPDAATVPDRGIVVDGDALLAMSVAFGRALHAEGLGAALPGAIDFARALTMVDVGDRDVVRSAGAAIFVRHVDEMAIYSRVFERFWRRGGAKLEGPGAPRRPRIGSAEDAAEGGEHGPDALDATSAPVVAVRRVGYSPVERLRHRDFATLTADEIRDAERMIDALAPRLPTRRSRRDEPHPHGRELDPRRMLRANLATGGEPLEWVWRRRRTRPRPLVVLADVSGSMDRYARLALRFAHALTRTPARVEAFAFGTRIVRVTRFLRQRDPDRALAAIAGHAPFGAGGTRIGEAFRDFNRIWARRVLPTSGVVIVISDGWDHGRPQLIREETARLSRACHRLVWLNPLAAARSYEPSAAGMAAALPSVDHFLPAASVANLEQLGLLLARLGPGSAASMRPAVGST